MSQFFHDLFEIVFFAGKSSYKETLFLKVEIDYDIKTTIIWGKCPNITYFH